MKLLPMSSTIDASLFQIIIMARPKKSVEIILSSDDEKSDDLNIKDRDNPESDDDDDDEEESLHLPTPPATTRKRKRGQKEKEQGKQSNYVDCMDLLGQTRRMSRTKTVTIMTRGKRRKRRCVYAQFHHDI
jgi:hypothetical protein